MVNLILKHKREIFILLILIACYFLLRLPNLTLQPIFADEAIYIRWAQVMKSEPTLRFLPLSDGKTPLFMWGMIPLFKVFSDPLFAGRFLSVISGFFTLLGVFFLAKKVFNIKVALWATLLCVITPYILFFDRMALVDSMLSAFSIWSLYFAIWLIKSIRLDLAMVLGFILGGGILTKTPGMINLLILPITLLGFQRKKNDRFHLLKALGLLTIAIGISLFMYNALRLGPNFHQLSARNNDYIFSPLELKDRPLDPFIPHFHDLVDWFPKLFTLPVLILAVAGGGWVIWGKHRFGMVILFWALLPLLLEMAFLKTFTARYLLTSIAPLLILAGFALSKILEKFKLHHLMKIAICLAFLLPLPLRFDYQLIENPPPKDLPKEERKGYFEDWTAGYGLGEIGSFLREKSKEQSVVVGTEGFFGTLPDGLYIYLDKTNIAVLGSHATISAKIRNAAGDNLTYFVGNKMSLMGNIKNAIPLKEYPKAKPVNGEADATVLYQVLP